MKSKGSKRLGVLGIYKRKIVFFFLLFLVGFGLVQAISGARYSADSVVSDSGLQSATMNMSVEILPDGKIKVDGKTISQEVDFKENELRLAVLDQPDSYLDSVTITLTLPKNVANDTTIDFLAIHGVGSTDKFVQNDNTIVYQASNVSPYATLSIIAKLPSGTVTPSLWSKSKLYLLGLKANVWLFTAIALPFLSFLVMVIFLIYQRKRQQVDVPETETDVPPMAIPPAMVGALYNQKVGPREIAATLIDLAERGDIVILDRERGFAFGKGRLDQRLLPFEKILLAKIFKDNITSDRAEIDHRVNNHFYSRKMSAFSSGVYSLTTRLGYFKQNPQKSLAKYRLIGILFFLFALGGFFASLIWFTTPSYAVFFWVGMMISSLVISTTAGRLPIRTIIGQEVLSNWLAFKKFLENPKPYLYSRDEQDIFQKYLPYAIVLNCESAWAKRFEEHNFVMPDWFASDQTGLGLDDFCLSLFPIVSYVGRSLASIREPGFE